MKLVFEKKNPQDIKVKIDNKGDINDFDYVTMLKGLLTFGLLEESVLIGDFTNIEKNSISSMVERLNKCIPLKDGKVDLDSDLVEDDDSSTEIPF